MMHFYTVNTSTGEMLEDDAMGQYAKRTDIEAALGLRLVIQCNECKRTLSGTLLQVEAYPYKANP